MKKIYKFSHFPSTKKNKNPTKGHNLTSIIQEQKSNTSSAHISKPRVASIRTVYLCVNWKRPSTVTPELNKLSVYLHTHVEHTWKTHTRNRKRSLSFGQITGVPATKRRPLLWLMRNGQTVLITHYYNIIYLVCVLYVFGIENYYFDVACPYGIICNFAKLVCANRILNVLNISYSRNRVIDKNIDSFGFIEVN